MVDVSPERLGRLRAWVPAGRVQVEEVWLTAETVDGVIASRGFRGEIDLLSIDIDGNDYWLWSRIESVSARIVVVEYNSMLGAERALVVPYDPDFRRRSFPDLKGTYYGASLAAHAGLGRSLGYRLVALEPRGNNAYFIRDDLAPHFPAIEPAAEFRLLDKYAAMLEPAFDFWGLVERHGLPLLELEQGPDSSPVP